MQYLIAINVEIKDEHGAPSNDFPSDAEVAAYAYQSLREIVRPEYDINWMPTAVHAVRREG